jgi:hypothetical protein
VHVPGLVCLPDWRSARHPTDLRVAYLACNIQGKNEQGQEEKEEEEEKGGGKRGKGGEKRRREKWREI